MDNQQERLEWEIAWLAAMVEGEGWISLTKNSSLQCGKRYFRFDPNCGISNTEKDLIDECCRILSKYKVEHQVIKRKGSGLGLTSLERYEIILRCSKRAENLINLIFPFLIGIKKIKAKSVIEFIEIRRKKGKSSSYGNEEHAIYEKMFAYKGKTQSKILNDYTPSDTLVMC